MELLICIAAATVAFVVRALWAMVTRSPLERALGAPVSNRGYPFSQSPMPYLVAGACLMGMAVMMRGMFLRYGIDTLLEGLGIGVGIGALIAFPLIVLQNDPPRHSGALTLIDGGSALLICASLGAILGAI